jgi:hypothetical protein
MCALGFKHKPAYNPTGEPILAARKTEKGIPFYADLFLVEHGFFMQGNPQTSGQNLDPHQYSNESEPMLLTASGLTASLDARIYHLRHCFP